MAGAYQIDERFVPLLRVQWLKEPTDDEFEAYLVDLLSIMKRADATRRIIVLDSSSGAAITPAQRRRKSDWIAQHRSLIAQRTMAIVFVYDSAIMRGMLTAILWFSPLPAPHFVCPTPEAALVECERILAEHGFPVPKGVRDAWTTPTKLTRARS